MSPKTIVYVLRSMRNPARHYTGLTSDLNRRLAWHNAGDNVSTADDRTWCVSVAIHFSDKAIAERFENYLKTGSGREVAKRISNDWGREVDLLADRRLGLAMLGVRRDAHNQLQCAMPVHN